MVMPASRTCSAISFGVFWRLAPSTRPIIRSRNDSAGIDRDPNHDPVGEHLGAAGDRRAVAAALADHRRRLAGDRRLVHRGDALDDLAVAGDDLAGLDHDHVALAQLGGGDQLLAAVHELAGHGLLAQPAERRRLGLAAALGQRLGEVREEDGEPEPERHLAR